MEHYWTSFYSIFNITDESDFAKFIEKYIVINTNTVLYDIGCGNMRDTNYFKKKGINCIGIDKYYKKANIVNDIFTVLNDNLILSQYILNNFNIYEPTTQYIYMRFFLHTLSIDEIQLLIEKIYCNFKKVTIFIETRTCINKDYEITYFKGPIGDVHYRLLLSENYLRALLLNQGFNIEYINSATHYSKFSDDAPLLTRIIAHK